MKIVGNRIHHIAGDGIQGLGNGTDVLIDRNEIGYVGANPRLVGAFGQHPDHRQRPEPEDHEQLAAPAGLVRRDHVGWERRCHLHPRRRQRPDDLREHLIEHSRGRVEVCGLGTGGTSRSNITVRRNTVSDNGQTFGGFPGLEWDCGSGTGNLVEPQHRSGPRRRFRHPPYRIQVGVLGEQQPVLPAVARQPRRPRQLHVIDCNPAGQEAIGYRKPAGVPW